MRWLRCVLFHWDWGVSFKAYSNHSTDYIRTCRKCGREWSVNV
jgi:hypothetical protein